LPAQDIFDKLSRKPKAAPPATAPAKPPAVAPAPGPGSPAAAASAGSWVRVQSPLGFTLQHPSRWQVRASTAANIRVVSADARRFAGIEAVTSQQQRVDPQALLQQYIQSGRLSGRRDDVILRIAARSPGVAAAGVRFQGPAGVTRANLLLALAGPTGTLMAAVAPEAEFQQALPELVAILKSFSFTGGQSSSGAAAAPSPRPNLRYTQVVDSAQNAFSLEMPQGWRNQAQMVQPDVTDLRPEIVSQSPQGDATVSIGDRNVGGFLAPNQTMMSLGNQEGQMTGGKIILRYLPGAQFGVWWLPRKFSGLRVLSQRDRPDYAKKWMEAQYRFGNPNRGQMHSGEIEFEWRGQTGFALITTEVLANQVATLWYAKELIAVVAAPQQVPAAYQAIGHMLGTIRYNPRWVMETMRITAEAAQRQLEYIRYSAQLQQQTLNYRWEILDRQQRVRGDLIRNQVRLRDPDTGEEFTTTAGSNFYYRPRDWRDNDKAIGTDQYHRQGDFTIDVTELVRIDP
jgi:hypothetical protein